MNSKNSYANPSVTPTDSRTEVVAVLGDGQLARMMQQPAIALGIHLRILSSNLDNSAAQVIPDTILGKESQWKDIEQTVHDAHVVTFEHEHISGEFIQRMIDQGMDVQPSPQALQYAQDKLLMRQKLESIGVPVPPYAAINSVEDAVEFFVQHKGHVCIKTRTGGYDGHGVWFPSSEEALVTLVSELLGSGASVMAELKVNLVRELSALIARNPQGEAQAWPVVETVQKDGICVQATYPPVRTELAIIKQARGIAYTVAEALEVTGVLAVELFETIDTEARPCVLVNELAMRPHNTGHWTQDGAVTSQFEQHLRAVSGRPLGDTSPTVDSSVMANVLGALEDPDSGSGEFSSIQQRMDEVWKRYPQAKIHWYGKTWKPGRKIGHVNMTSNSQQPHNKLDGVSMDDVEELEKMAAQAATMLSTGQWQ